MRGSVKNRNIPKPDIIFNSQKVEKFINYVMERGKKTVSEDIVYSAFDILKEKTKEDSLDIFDKAIKNVTPLLEIRSKRVGGANYQIPVPVRGERKLALAYHWIIDAARKKKGRPMAEKLAGEILDAYNNQGDAIKKKQDVHRMAEANRAFAHFAKF